MMKRIFTFTLLMLAFAMNAVAWEPVIKEKHWFGMNEYYNAPVFGITNYADVTVQVQNSGFGSLDGWSADCSTNSYHSEGRGNIGYWRVYEHDNIEKAREDDNHPGWMSCIGLECRWSGNWSSYTQTVNNLPTGVYKLSYDVMNGNSQTAPATYENLFFVEINGKKYTDLQTEWMSDSTTWTTHTIEFRISGSANVKISLGYGTGSNYLPLEHTPALYVSRLKLESAKNEDSYKVSTINWENNFLESMVVTRDWTYDGYSPNPKTSFYSWLDHKKRFSVDHTDFWWPGRNTKLHNVLGLKNFSSSAENFRIHDLNAGDQINIEYYRDPNNTDVPHLVSGDLSSTNDENGRLTTGSSIYGAQNNTPTFYTVLSNGDLCFDIPRGAIIRSVTIILKKYEKATAEVTPLTQEEQDTYGGKGYRYTLKGSGVLEDKHGAVPYITMRFGAEKDMTFVRDLGNNKFGAACIVDGSNNLNPSTAKLQEYDKVYTWEEGEGNNKVKHYYYYTEEDVRTRLEGKEWTVFTAEQWLPESGNKGDLYNSIFPLYGSYYYFFPEVDGKLIVTYYCEGNNDGPAFWWKVKDLNQLKTSYNSQTEYNNDENFPGVGDQPKLLGRTNGSNIYTFEVDVKKDGVYYLCSNPTNIQHEHPIIRLMSYAFVPNFRVDPLYKVVDNASQSVPNAATITGLSDKGVVIERFTGASSDGTLNNNEIITINGEDAPIIKFLGNVEGATVKLRGTASEGIKLDFSNITYKNVDKVNKGGAIVVNLECPAGKATFVLTVAYSAADATMDNNNSRNGVNTQVKKWDFFSGAGEKDELLTGHGWDIGKYGTVDVGDKSLYSTNYSAWQGKSKLFKEVNKYGGLTADWIKTYMNLKGNNEPIFKSVYDMEGDNADMLHETAGLIFLTESNLMGIYNENGEYNSSDKTFQDRYIGLLGPSELPLKNEDTGEEHPRALIIPLLRANDRIVIKMGCYGNLPGDEIATKTAKLKISGAYDATGQTEITGDYIIGGSGVEANNNPNGDTFSDKSKPFGEYHFVATGGENGTAKDFKLEVVEADLLKIYSIEIYRNAANDNADILTENKVKGTDENNTREILYTGADTNTKSIGLQLNYRGLNESTAPLNHVRMTGNIDEQNDITVTSSGDTHTYSTPKPTKATGAQFENGKFGAFKTRIAVKTLQGGAYVTDYADCMVPVGFREKLDYPNTWDFTDLREKYVTVKENDVVTNGIDDATGNEKPVANGDLKIWDNWSLTAAPENFDGNLFVSGGQLYAGSKMFDETRGLGIVHNGSNGILSLTATTESGEGAISISNADSYGFIVPQVAAGQAVYVHATPISGQDQSAQFAIGEGSPQAFTYTNDNTFAMKMADDASTSDVKLCFQGYEVNKIAVATDEKTVNNFGWNTESRDHAIDPSLTAYMTGKDFRTYIVTDADVEKNTVTLVRIDGGSENPENPEDITADNTDNKLFVPAATINGSVNACIVRYVDKNAPENEQTVNIFNDGKFHLFVPDMHDASAAAATSLTGNLLKARVTATTNSDKVPRDETIERTTYNNYAFTNKHRNVVMGGEWKYDVQAFYRIVSGGAGSDGNQAYLSIPGSGTSASRSAEPSNSSAVPQTYDIVFKDWSDLMTEKGDVNGDGMVTRPDIDVLSGYVTARYSNGLFKRMGDMNDDGRIDIVDMTLLIKKIMSE